VFIINKLVTFSDLLNKFLFFAAVST